jgi:hypothetical protein
MDLFLYLDKYQRKNDVHTYVENQENRSILTINNEFFLWRKN